MDKEMLLYINKKLENMNQREKNIFFDYIGIEHQKEKERGKKNKKRVLRKKF